MRMHGCDATDYTLSSTDDGSLFRVLLRAAHLERDRDERGAEHPRRVDGISRACGDLRRSQLGASAAAREGAHAPPACFRHTAALCLACDSV